MDDLFLIENDSGVDLDAVLVAAGFDLGHEHGRIVTALDTFDGRLHRKGMRLSRVDSPIGTTLRLTERGVPDAHLVGGGPVRFAAELPNGPFRARLERASARRALLPVVTVRSRCREAARRDRRGAPTIEVTLHRDVFTEAARSSHLSTAVVEIHEMLGHADDAASVRRLFHDLGLRPAPNDLLTAAGEVAGAALTGHSNAPGVDMDPDEPAIDVFRRVLHRLADIIEQNLPGAIEGTDTEFLHDLRIAVRRTRSVLSEARGILPSDIRSQYRRGFGWLGAVTGPARDLDVALLHWDDFVAPLRASDRDALKAVVDELRARRDGARGVVARELGRPRARDLLDEWRSWLASDALAPQGGSVAVSVVVERRIDRAHRRVIRHGRAITPDSGAAMLHGLRKDAKRLRYLVECFSGVLSPEPAKAFVERMKRLQDTLGAHQDADVQALQLRRLTQELFESAAIDAEALLAMGRLTAHLDDRRLAARSAFASRFERFDSKRTVALQASLVRRARRQ